jgi:hypothetical protein
MLREVGVTHILNAAGGTGSSILYILTGQSFYEEREFPCKYLGLPMTDTDSFPIKDYFLEGASFIQDAIDKKGITYIFIGNVRSSMSLSYVFPSKNLGTC